MSEGRFFLLSKEESTFVPNDGFLVEFQQHDIGLLCTDKP